ncbi:hypothetical protein FQA39_LY02348 [Lamprigera yunnana]|nr:hypothetical protein FQA39_LY02348 [Lamprigera yunnana]
MSGYPPCPPGRSSNQNEVNASPDIQEFYELTLLDESKSIQQKTAETIRIANKWETSDGPIATPFANNDFVLSKIVKMKFIVFAAVIAFAKASGVAIAPLAPAPPLRSYFAAAPLTTPLLKTAPVVASKTVALTDADFDPNPQYSYAYDIQDALTGDSKNHYETRNGDAVQGSYSLVDADGTRRIVEYTADPVNGFNAVVHKEPLAVKAIATPVAAPIVYSGPLPYAAHHAKVAAPLTYSSPFAKVATPLFSAKTIVH